MSENINGIQSGIFLGKQAIQLFENKKFLDSYKNLFNNCEWATAFQQYDFVYTWYQHYFQIYHPVLIISVINGELSGIFTLANINEEKIVGAGYDQAEYQVWISSKDNSSDFFSYSIELLKKTFPNTLIHLKYIPSDIATDTAISFAASKNNIFKKIHQQPVIRIDSEALAVELKKKNKREKVNRLKRIGKLEFYKIDQTELFENILDTLIIQHDFRKGAVYGKLTFQLDPNRKGFLIDLYKKNLLHVTILTLENQIISSNVGILGTDMVHLSGINSHSPFHSKFSPGILHFLMLGLKLHEEGIGYFDLTPGKDNYKLDLANSFFECNEIKIENQFGFITDVVRESMKNFVKKKLFPDKDLKLIRKEWEKKLLKIRRLALTPIRRKKFPAYWILNGTEKVLNEFFRIDWEKIKTEGSLKVYENKIEDLIQFSMDKDVYLEDFLAESMNKIELGYKFYSYSENKILKFCIWLAPENAKINKKGIFFVDKSQFLFISVISKEINGILFKKILSEIFSTYGIDSETKVLLLRDQQLFLQRITDLDQLFILN